MRGTVLVTGGAGFIGSNLTAHLVEVGADVIVLDKLTYAGSVANLDPVWNQIEFYRGDVTDRDLVVNLLSDADYVVNLAAESHVDRSIESGSPFVESNVRGTFVLLDELRNADVERFLQMSTDEVYGSIERGTADESATLEPSSPYSASKASADLFTTAFRKTYNLPIAVARCTNVYGPRQHPEKFIPKMISQAAAGESLSVYGDGTNRREWLYVSDVCTALERILLDGAPETYNVGGGTEKENLEVLSAIIDRLNRSADLIEFVEDRPGHDYRYALDWHKIERDLNWSPSVSFDEGLDRTLAWYLDRGRART
jgi:dTDP-glucose 4,6-dehydratase